MKKILLLSALIFTQTVMANPDKYVKEFSADNESGRRLRNCVRAVIKTEQDHPNLLAGRHIPSKSVSDIFNSLDASSYGALNEENLKTVSLETKYNCLKGILEFRSDEKINEACLPLHIAQRILNSFQRTEEAKPEILYSYMKNVINYIKPISDDLEYNTWCTFFTYQARDKALPKDLRRKFAKLYGKIDNNPSYKKFSYKLLSEI